MILILLVWGSGQQPRPVSASPPVESSGKIVRGQILVKFRFGVDARLGGRLAAAGEAEPARAIERLGVHRFRVPPDREHEFVERFARHPLVEYAEPDHEVSVAVQPNDPYVVSYQWHLAKIEAPAAWDVTTGANYPVAIAIVDTGVDGQHPDLAGRTVGGFNVLTDQPILPGTNSDDSGSGHGTHVAGIAAANTNNGVGVAGVSWSASIMPIKILDATGYGTFSDLAEGIVWAADHSARVINLSLGGTKITDGETRTIKAAVEYARGKGAFLAAAAGNEGAGSNSYNYPAALDHVIAVAATTPQDEWAYFSNYHPYVDVAAPGVGIYSTTPNGGFTSRSGTSMATPVVSGIAALLLAANPSLTADQIAARLEATALDLGSPGKDIYFGAGRVSAARALLTDSLAVEPRTLVLSAGPGAAASGVITIRNLTAGTVRWQARSNADWLTLSGSSSQTGQLAPHSSSQIVVTLDPQRRPSGLASGTIQIGPLLGDQLISPRTVQVQLISRLYLPMLTRESASGR